jgi:hypothetical protein
MLGVAVLKNISWPEGLAALIRLQSDAGTALAIILAFLPLNCGLGLSAETKDPVARVANNNTPSPNARRLNLYIMCS